MNEDDVDLYSMALGEDFVPNVANNEKPEETKKEEECVPNQNISSHEYPALFRQLLVGSRSQINRLKKENKQLAANLENATSSGGVVVCPNCTHHFKERQCLLRPRNIKKMRARNTVELEFQSEEDLVSWLYLNQLETNSDGLPTVMNVKRGSDEPETLTTVGSLLPGLMAKRRTERNKEEEKNKQNEVEEEKRKRLRGREEKQRKEKEEGERFKRKEEERKKRRQKEEDERMRRKEEEREKWKKQREEKRKKQNEEEEKKKKKKLEEERKRRYERKNEETRKKQKENEEAAKKQKDEEECQIRTAAKRINDRSYSEERECKLTKMDDPDKGKKPLSERVNFLLTKKEPSPAREFSEERPKQQKAQIVWDEKDCVDQLTVKKVPVMFKIPERKAIFIKTSVLSVPSVEHKQQKFKFVPTCKKNLPVVPDPRIVPSTSANVSCDEAPIEKKLVAPPCPAPKQEAVASVTWSLIPVKKGPKVLDHMWKVAAERQKQPLLRPHDTIIFPWVRVEPEVEKNGKISEALFKFEQIGISREGIAQLKQRLNNPSKEIREEIRHAKLPADDVEKLCLPFQKQPSASERALNRGVPVFPPQPLTSPASLIWGKKNTSSRSSPASTFTSLAPIADVASISEVSKMQPICNQSNDIEVEDSDLLAEFFPEYGTEKGPFVKTVSSKTLQAHSSTNSVFCETRAGSILSITDQEEAELVGLIREETEVEPTLESLELKSIEDEGVSTLQEDSDDPLRIDPNMREDASMDDSTIYEDEEYEEEEDETMKEVVAEGEDDEDAGSEQWWLNLEEVQGDGGTIEDLEGIEEEGEDILEVEEESIVDENEDEESILEEDEEEYTEDVVKSQENPDSERVADAEVSNRAVGGCFVMDENFIVDDDDEDAEGISPSTSTPKNSDSRNVPEFHPYIGGEDSIEELDWNYGIEDEYLINEGEKEEEEDEKTLTANRSRNKEEAREDGEISEDEEEGVEKSEETIRHDASESRCLLKRRRRSSEENRARSPRRDQHKHLYQPARGSLLKHRNS